MTEDEQQERYERLIRECWLTACELTTAPDLDRFVGAAELEMLRLTAGKLADIEAEIARSRKAEGRRNHTASAARC